MLEFVTQKSWLIKAVAVFGACFLFDSLFHLDMKLFLQKLLTFGSIGLSSLLVAANAQQQKPFQNHNALDVSSILKQHDKPNTLEAHEKHFQGDTLAYVTPWNNRGNMATLIHLIILIQQNLRL